MIAFMEMLAVSETSRRSLLPRSIANCRGCSPVRVMSPWLSSRPWPRISSAARPLAWPTVAIRYWVPVCSKR